MKRVSHNGLRKWIAPRGGWPWGIQIGSFAVHETYFCKMDFHFMNKLHAAFSFSCIQRKWHPSVAKVYDLLCVWGIQNGAIALHETYFCQNDFHFISPACREKGTLLSAQKWITQIGLFAVDETYFWKINFHFIKKPRAAFPFSCMDSVCSPRTFSDMLWQTFLAYIIGSVRP